jgi:RHS repeat-associated protein
VTKDDVQRYVYDGEGRQVTVRNLTDTGDVAEYLVDGAGVRVKKCLPNCSKPTTTMVYVFSLAEYVNGASPSAPTREYIYAGGQLVATHEGTSLRYHHADHLSVRVTTDTAGAKIGEQGHYSFGKSWYSASTTTKFQFTSYERDGESLNDYAIFRSHINRLGRFNSPDPVAGTLSNPQSLNRYGYVLNVPTSLVDPLGLSPFSLFENIGPLMHDGTLGFGGGGTLCYVNGARVPCSFAWSLVASGEGVALPPGVSEQGWALDRNGNPLWYRYEYSHKGMSMRFPFQESDGTETERLRKALKELLENKDCAKLLGGTESAMKLANRFHIWDVRNSAPMPGAEGAAWQLAYQHNSAVTVAYSRTGNIYVNSRFYIWSHQQKLVTLIHELRHQKYGLMGEPPFGTPQYRQYIRQEYRTIREACFEKRKG